jgi:hypothetical protein
MPIPAGASQPGNKPSLDVDVNNRVAFQYTFSGEYVEVTETGTSPHNILWHIWSMRDEHSAVPCRFGCLELESV